MKHNRLVAHVNKRDWWHVPPADAGAYQKRGRFYASSFREAEFWGRPLDQPQTVIISNPLVGDEDTIEKRLFGKTIPEPDPSSPKVLEWRWNVDAKIRKAALEKGYDAVVLMTPKGFPDYKASGRLPRSMELNVLKV